MDEFHLCVHQMAPRLGEVQWNCEEVLRRILQVRDSDLQLFPELALTGYGLRGRVSDFAFRLADRPPLDLPPDAPPVALGLPERGTDELIYNTAILLHGRGILATHRKIYLPTYGMFDEGRYFARGRRPPAVCALPSGWTVGLLVCEDLWHPGLLYLLAEQEVDLVLVLAAAPGRGVPDTPTALFSSMESWTLLARAAALQYGIYLAVANRAGVEGGVTFAGASFIVGPDGQVIGQAPQGDTAILEVTLSRGALRRSRSPFSHLRDDEPAYFLKALTEILQRSGGESRG